MKKQLLKMVALGAAVMFTGSVFAQFEIKSVDVIKNCGATPVIDGIVDDVWADIDAQAIDVAFGTETVSLGDGATFKATWDNDAVYILLEVPDDNFYPHTEAGVNSWQADKPELYWDVLDPKVDGGGPNDDAGHIQTAPGVDEVDSQTDYTTAYLVDANDANYVWEYALPWAYLNDGAGNDLDPEVMSTIGFDVTIIDLDETGLGGNDAAMGRVNWSNNTVDAVDGGAAGESWVTLDQSGDFTFEDDGGGVAIRTATVNNDMVYPNVAVEAITVNVEAAQYEVINSLGQVVIVSETNVINVSELQTGVYFVKANDQVARILKK